MKTDYDITIVGAGIQGAGVAQAASARGYSVLLLEQYESAAQGTSSRSSKLIHGGLRYLEQGELKLVYECLRERKLLLQNAPGLVKLRPFYIPIYKESARPAWLIRAGLCLYSVLAGLGKDTRFQTIPIKNWDQFPGLRNKGLQKVFCYPDAQTDDEQLTQSVIDSAESMGATIQYQAKFVHADKTERGYRINYEIDSSQTEISTRTLVLASGPWINSTMQNVSPKLDAPEIELIQGSHIILPGKIGEKIFYLQASDGRAVFVAPWNGDIMVGTTEKPYQGDPAQCAPSEHEIDYLLAIFNYFFPTLYPNKAKKSDILETFSGLRVLLKSKKNSFSRTRETIFKKDHKRKPRLVGIYGGKLTSYRATAEKTINILQNQLPKKSPLADTKNLKLK